MKLFDFMKVAKYNRLNVVFLDIDRNSDLYAQDREERDLLLHRCGNYEVVTIKPLFDPYAMCVEVRYAP